MLEPPAAEGRLSDLSFKYEGRRYRAECFRPTYKTKVEVVYELARLAQDCLEIARGYPVVLSIAIDLNGKPTVAARRELVSAVNDASRQVAEDTSQKPETFPTVLMTGPIGTVSVTRAVATQLGGRRIVLRHPSFPHTGDDWDYFARAGVGEVAAASGIHGTVEGMDGLSHFAVWPPPGLHRADQSKEDPDVSLERLGRKIESKLGQARSTTGEHRFLVVDVWQTRLLDGLPERGERLRRKVVESHQGVAGLLMVRREWKSDLGRHGYHIVPFLREKEPRLPDSLVVGLKERGP